MDNLQYWLILFMVIVAGALITEASILVISYIFADEVECTFLWCSFSTTKSYHSISQNCYRNGEPVDCLEVQNWKP